MGIGAIQSAHLEDVHQSLAHLAEIQPVFHVVAWLLLLSGCLDLNEKIPAAGLFHTVEHRQWQPCPFFQRASSPLIFTLVQHRGYGIGQDGCPVAHVKGYAVKADPLKFAALEDKVFNHSLDPLGGDLRLVFEVRIVISLEAEVPFVQMGDIELLRLHVH